MKNKLIFFILSLASVVTLAQNSSEPNPGSHPGFEAFKKNVYPIIHGTAEQPGQCVKCHNTSGPGPSHSSDDPWASYHMVLPYVNFQNLKYSKFVSKGMNGHGNAYGGQVTLTEEGMIDILNRWWVDGESQAFLKDKKILKSQELPSLPANGEYVTMSWELGVETESLKGMQFKIDVQRFAEADGDHLGANRFKNPRIESNGQMVKVQGIYFIVNGNPDTSANDYVSINMNVQYTGTLSFLQQIVLDAKGPKIDQIGIAFDEISLGNNGDKPQILMTEVEPSSKQAVMPTNVNSLPIVAPISVTKKLEAFNESLMGVSAHFAKIKAAEFDMGSPDDDPMRRSDENLHRVRLTKDYEFQVTPVTQVQWFLVMGQNPSQFQTQGQCDINNYYSVNTLAAQVPSGIIPGPSPGASPAPTPAVSQFTPGLTISMCAYHPVENVSWDDVQIFIQNLNYLQTEYIYRLPTEAEWEYVAHGGLPNEYAFGFGPEFDGQYGWLVGNSDRRTHQVATKLPISSPSDRQEYIYDMAGNVIQWMEDGQSSYPYSKGQSQFVANSVEIDPVAPPNRLSHEMRGGSHSNDERVARASNRGSDNNSHRHPYIGFRLVRTPKQN